MKIVAGADDMRLYQPTHKLAYNLQVDRSPLFCKNAIAIAVSYDAEHSEQENDN